MQNTHAAAPQPGSKTYIVYDRLSPSLRAHEVTSDMVAPRLRRGDVAIFDPADREPIHGEHFVVQWTRLDRRDVVEVSLEPGGWCFIWQNTVAAVGGGPSKKVRWCDGPCRPGGMEQSILGRVVGILAPNPSGFG